MNKKGQSLVMFVIMLPLMILALALVVDVGLMYNAKIRGERLLEEAKEKNLDLKEYFKINDIDAEIKNSSANDKNCDIINYRVESVFGKIIKIDDYLIEVSDC